MNDLVQICTIEKNCAKILYFVHTPLRLVRKVGSNLADSILNELDRFLLSGMYMRNCFFFKIQTKLNRQLGIRDTVSKQSDLITKAPNAPDEIEINLNFLHEENQ